MLTTDRLILRQARAADAADIHAFMSDPRAMAYWSTPPHPDLATTAAQVERMASAPAPTLYFVWEKDSTVIGMGGMHSGNEVGFMLHPDHWRTGLAREAMTAILGHLWRTTRHDHVHADADPRNAASLRLLASLGFHQTGTAKNTFCIDGVWSDSAYFRLNRPT
ncbi:MAG: GNAT family N-acetyltransferase [Pseudomonadota bacterium]